MCIRLLTDVTRAACLAEHDTFFLSPLLPLLSQIVHHMAKNALLLHDLATPGLLALIAAATNLYWPHLGFGSAPPIPPHYALLAALSIAAIAYVWYIVGAVRDMCRHLQIRCFHLGPPRGCKVTIAPAASAAGTPTLTTRKLQ